MCSACGCLIKLIMHLTQTNESNKGKKSEFTRKKDAQKHNVACKVVNCRLFISLFLLLSLVWVDLAVIRLPELAHSYFFKGLCCELCVEQLRSSNLL